MYSLKNEWCHAIARLPSKLETGCRQVLHKLKSCEETETKVTNKWRNWKSQAFPENHSRIHYTGTLSGSSWGGEVVNKDRETSSLVPLQYSCCETSQMLFHLPPVRTPSFKWNRAKVGRICFQKGQSCKWQIPHASVDLSTLPRVTATGSLLELSVHQIQMFLPPAHQPEGMWKHRRDTAHQEHKRKSNMQIWMIEVFRQELLFFTWRTWPLKLTLSCKQWNYSSPSTKPTVQRLAHKTRCMELCLHM